MAKLGKTFSRLVSASQSFEKRAEYIEVNLQFLIEESNQRIVGVEQREQSTPTSIIPPVVKSGGGIQVQLDKKNSLAGSRPTSSGAGRSIIGGANINIFVFCVINFF